MATNSTISRVDSDTGEVITVYCRTEGEENGKKLRMNYSTEDSVIHLLSMGSIDILGSSIANSVFYGRDHEEEWDTAGPTCYVNWDSFTNKLEREPFNYVFHLGEWFLLKRDNSMVPVKSVKRRTRRSFFPIEVPANIGTVITD